MKDRDDHFHFNKDILDELKFNFLMAMEGSSGTPSGDNPYVTGSDPGVLDTEEVTTTSKSMEVSHQYIANNVGLVTLTLPSAAALGDMIKIRGKGAGMWKVAQNAGQTIHFLGMDTTTGAAGYLQATLRYDCLGLQCITADTDWIVTEVMGNITVA